MVGRNSARSRKSAPVPVTVSDPESVTYTAYVVLPDGLPVSVRLAGALEHVLEVLDIIRTRAVVEVSYG